MSRAHLHAFLLCALCAFITIYLIFDSRPVALLGAACFGVFLIFGNEYLRVREYYLISLCAISSVLAYLFLAKPAPLLAEGAIRAAYLSAFYFMLSVLRDGAMTSTSVLHVGRYLTQQPPNRRYWALAGGGHIMGVMMNFGALILLSPLVQRGAKDETGTLSPEIVAIREQRQLCALIRGFSWFIAWAPTSIAQVVVVTIVTGASAFTVAVMGAIAAVLVIIAGWIEDWFFGAKLRKRLGPSAAPAVSSSLPTKAFQRLGAVYALLIGLSLLIAWLLDTRLVNGIMLSALPITAIWITAQLKAGHGDGRDLKTRAYDIAVKALPKGTPEAATLALGGFTGTVLAGVVPPEALENTFALFGTHTALLYISITTMVVLLSIIGMPPMLTVTFLGGAAARTQGLGLDPNLLAVALLYGWTINLTGSPFGGSNLIMSRQTGIPVKTLAFQWNTRFSIAAFIICAAILARAS